MSTEAVDRRVRRTRKQLRECLVTLLKLPTPKQGFAP